MVMSTVVQASPNCLPLPAKASHRPKPTTLPLHNNLPHFSNQPLLSIIDRCSDARQLLQLHARMLRLGIFFDPYSASRLFTAASASDLDYARKLFDQIPHPNLYTWNTLIRAYASSSNPHDSFLVFLQMLRQCPDLPNKFTFPFLIKAASQLSSARVGGALHGTVIKASLASDVFILNALVHFYGSCKNLDSAHRIFVNIPQKDVVSWNSIINAFAQGECLERALELFHDMEAQNITPNGVTMISILSACAKNGDLEVGKWVHSYIEKNEIEDGLKLTNAILDMYAKCGCMDEAKRVFDTMLQKDVISWTTMVVGYAKLGDYDEARHVFHSMPGQDIAAWNALISAYEQNGKAKEALTLFHELQLSKVVKPDMVTLVSTLSACAQFGAIESGRWIHVYIKRRGLKLNNHLTTSLIDMYAKCGDLDKALEVFQSVEGKDVFVWSAMIGGLAMHGRGRDAVQLFLKMEEAKVQPNAVTFTNLLCACSHTGLVEEGRMFFSQMESVYGVTPADRHYACAVDILGRAGLLKEAAELVESMPVEPSTSVWIALLGAARTQIDVELAEHASARLLELDPGNHAAYVLLSNTYAKAGKWDKVPRLRRLMRNNGVKKEPGCSSIEVDGKLHEFLVGHNTHPLSKRIYSKLNEITRELKSVGYVPDKSQLLQCVEEENMQEKALYLHSEKLAVSFALLGRASSQPIRIVKNLRVCGDCHTFVKLVSSHYDREILLRDRYRFHHFKDGHCSCMDYW